MARNVWRPGEPSGANAGEPQIIHKLMCRWCDLRKFRIMRVESEKTGIQTLICPIPEASWLPWPDGLGPLLDTAPCPLLPWDDSLQADGQCKQLSQYTVNCQPYKCCCKEVGISLTCSHLCLRLWQVQLPSLLLALVAGSAGGHQKSPGTDPREPGPRRGSKCWTHFFFRSPTQGLRAKS